MSTRRGMARIVGRPQGPDSLIMRDRFFVINALPLCLPFGLYCVCGFLTAASQHVRSVEEVPGTLHPELHMLLVPVTSRHLASLG